MKLIRRFRALFCREKLDAEMTDEMRTHLELQAQENERRGMTAEEASRVARRDFGGVEQMKERARDVRGGRWLEQLGQDARYALRMMRRSPGFTAVVVLSLGLAIAANTTIFGVANAVLLRPPPVHDPDGLWQVWLERLKAQPGPSRHQGLTYPDYVALRDETRSFAVLAAFDPETPFVSWGRAAGGQQVQCQFVSGNFFAVCGIAMAHGRAFGAEEDRVPGAHPVAVVSHDFWRVQLGADEGALGRTLTINGVDLRVVGVAPEGFRGLIGGLTPDMWAPYAMAPAVRHGADALNSTGSYSHFGVGRLRPGVTPAQAAAELSGAIRRVKAAQGRADDFGVSVFPSKLLPTPFRGTAWSVAGVLLGAALLVLLVACANAANLLLARTVARSREIAVRAALGASRGRLMRQMLTESLLLAGLSGAVGVLLTAAILPALQGFLPPTLPLRPDFGIDGRVFAFTAGMALLTGIAFGLAPAWHGVRESLVGALKHDPRAGGPRRAWLSRGLVVGQVAVCFVLLIAGTLCLRSLFNARHAAFGFKTEQRVTVELNLKDYGYTPAQMRQFNEAWLERAGALPGVRSAAIADRLPLDTRSLSVTYRAEGHEPPPGQEGTSFLTFDVGHDYFAAMGTVLLQGREFAAADHEDAPQVAILNRTLAQRLWPDGSALGKRLFQGAGPNLRTYEIVGVVEDGKYRTLDEAPRPVVFRSRFQQPRPRSTFVAHVEGDPAAALAALREVTRELDARMAPSRLATLEGHLGTALFPARAAGTLFGVLGGVGLVLAVAGLFGVIGYSVSQRTREIGIRMALGAARGDMARMVLRQGLTLAGIGMALGLLIAGAATKLLQTFLVGVSPTDPTTFGAVTAFLLVIALLACWLPARRAAKVDPMVALRSE